jgi:hypothetical protein
MGSRLSTREKLRGKKPVVTRKEVLEGVKVLENGKFICPCCGDEVKELKYGNDKAMNEVLAPVCDFCWNNCSGPLRSKILKKGWKKNKKCKKSSYYQKEKGE